jgi:hypothetical protein
MPGDAELRREGNGMGKAGIAVLLRVPPRAPPSTVNALLNTVEEETTLLRGKNRRLQTEKSPFQRENLAIPPGKPLAYASEPFTFTPDGPAVSG